MKVRKSGREAARFSKMCLICILVTALAGMDSAYPQSGDFIPDIMERFTDVSNYYPEGKEKVRAMNDLLKEAGEYKETNQENAEAWFIVGFLRRAAMAVDDDFGVIASIREGKKVELELNKALELDEAALDGYAQAFMGSWLSIKPFGDKKAAREHLLKGLAIAPEGLMTNFHYGAFLSTEGDKQEAMKHLQKASAAEIRPRTPKWDQRFKSLADTIMSTL